MKFFRLDLLTLLISLFILNSCKNQDNIGLTNATGTISGTLVDTATVFTNTTNDDTVITSGITKSPLGYFKDPVLGTSTSNLITDLNLPGGEVSTNATYTVPAGTIYIDSAVLALNYADGFYGDSLTSRYKVNVYQLNQRLFQTQTYYNNSSFSYNSGVLLGTKTFYARPHDSLKVTDIVTGGPDTLKKVPPQIRIPIDTNFIRSILFTSSNPDLTSNLIFLNTVKGFFITMDQNQPGAGGTMMITAPGDSSLAVYMRNINGTTIDTVVLYMNISQHAAQITHVYSSAVKNAVANTTTHTDSLIYLQGLASLRAKIQFPYITSLFKNIGVSNVVINRAEIVITPQPGSDIPSYLVPQPQLTLYRYDDALQRVEVEDALSTDPRDLGSNAIFGGYWTPFSQGYHFLVTAYVQDLVLGKVVDHGTFIAPIDTTNTSSIDITPTPETAGRTIGVGNVTNTKSPLYPYRIRLNVIYTKTTKQ
jgi:hypothetical protein